MSLSLLYNTQKGRKGKIGTLEIEATLSESHDLSSTVSRYSVENGANISDHIVNEPDSITLEGFISNTPVDPSLGGGGSSDRAQDAFDTLYDLRDKKELVVVVSQFKVYEDMAITKISVPRDSSTGQAIRFSVDLQKVVKVGQSGSSLGGLGAISDLGGQLASVQKTLGKVTSLIPSPATISKASSVVRSMFS